MRNETDHLIYISERTHSAEFSIDDLGNGILMDQMDEGYKTFMMRSMESGFPVCTLRVRDLTACGSAGLCGGYPRQTSLQRQ